MRKKIIRFTVLVAGWAFILVGIVGLFLPILQGVAFILLGLVLLSTEYVWAHRLLEKLKGRFPKLYRQFEAASARAGRWRQRFNALCTEDRLGCAREKDRLDEGVALGAKDPTDRNPDTRRPERDHD